MEADNRMSFPTAQTKLLDSVFEAIGDTSNGRVRSIQINIVSGEPTSITVRWFNGDITHHHQRKDGTFYTVNP